MADLSSCSVTVEFEGVEGDVVAVVSDEDKVIGW